MFRGGQGCAPQPRFHRCCCCLAATSQELSLSAQLPLEGAGQRLRQLRQSLNSPAELFFLNPLPAISPAIRSAPPLEISAPVLRGVSSPPLHQHLKAGTRLRIPPLTSKRVNGAGRAAGPTVP